MRRLILILAALMVVAAASASAMTADELIDKALDAQGGEKALKAVESMKATGKFIAMGMEFPFTMVQARPNKMRIDADINGQMMVQVWDGEKGWMINPMMGTTEPQDMGPVESKSFKLQADLDGLLVDYADKGYTVEYVGEDEVEGTPVYHLKLDTHEDLVVDMFLDQEYHLLIKQTGTMAIEGQEVSSDTYMSDFKEVGGLVIPHAIETRMGGQTVNNIQLETVELDVEVDEGQFEKPAASK
ncbi:hypothetical protein GF314_03795 [bacterium]|nr:hypothetical protein [bacterium]